MSNTTQHTPGPWNELAKANGFDSVTDAITIARKSRETAAERDRLRLINARLIDAMTGILQSAGFTSGEHEPTLHELNVSIQALQQARAAIAQATAETETLNAPPSFTTITAIRMDRATASSTK